MQLSTVQRLKLHLRQPLLSALKIDGNVPVKLEETGDGLVAVVDGRRVHIPAALCWKFYRKGWEGRLDRLEQEYGVGERFLLDETSLVLDIGANTGEFAHVVARHGARAFCFEPDPSVFACLEKNTRGLSGIALDDRVLWKEDGAVQFGLAPERHDSSVFAEGAPKVERPAIRLDSFAREAGLSQVTLLKCDAEGAEPEVLEGAGAFLKQVANVSIDTGPERMGARTHVECKAILEDAGFDVLEDKIGTRHMTYGVNRAL
ncbi:MAG: FkbM family methyltransferase [Parvularculaceae bacterium]|nr:FkbM family methyltransferase [Parvularculaceae bacterium]